MYNNNYQQGSPAQGGQRPPKKPVVNQWEGEGIVTTRGINSNDPIKFFQFKNGGGAIHITLVCMEPGPADASGNAKTQTTYVPVNVMTNKNISEQQLRSVIPGMRVHVKGKLQVETYESKRTNEKKSALVVNACYLFEILEMPSQQAYYGAQPQFGQPAPAGYGMQGGFAPMPQGQMYPPPGAQQPYPAQQPYNPYVYPGAPAYGQFAPPQQQMPSPYPQGAPAAQKTAPAPKAAPHTVPPYYQPPQQQSPEEEDLPPADMPMHDINV